MSAMQLVGSKRGLGSEGDTVMRAVGLLKIIRVCPCFCVSVAIPASGDKFYAGRGPFESYSAVSLLLRLGALVLPTVVW